MNKWPQVVNRLTLMLACLLLVGGCSKESIVRQDTGDGTGALGEAKEAKPTGQSGEIYVKLAVAYMQSGQMDVALQQAKKALRVEPGNADAHNIIALIYDRLLEDRAAERHYRSALQLEPENSYIRNAYGTFLCTRGRYPESISEFEAALANPLYRTPELAYTNAGICIGKQGDLVQSEKYLRKALEVNPRFPNALIEMAKLELARNRYRSARDYVLRFSRASGHSAESLWVGIQAARKLGDRDMASNYMMQLNNSYPDSPEAGLARDSSI